MLADKMIFWKSFIKFETRHRAYARWRVLVMSRMIPIESVYSANHSSVAFW